MASQNYTLGRGRLYFDQFITDTFTTTGERYIGNTPDFGMSVESESLDHYSADEGLRIKDDSVTIEVNYAGQFNTDEISPENLAMFFLGDAATISATSTSVTDEAVEGVQQGQYYQLGRDTSSPSGVRKISAVTIVASGGTPTYSEGTDYSVDLDLARVYIISGGGISDDDDLEANYTIDAGTREQVVSAGTTVEGTLRFVSHNAKGTKRDYFFPYVKLAPSGDFALKGEDWLQIAFDVEAMQLDTNTATVYIDGRPS